MNKKEAAAKDVDDFNSVVDATSGFLKAVYPPARSLVKAIKENQKSAKSPAKASTKTKSTVKKTRKSSKEKAAPAPAPVAT